MISKFELEARSETLPAFIPVIELHHSHGCPEIGSRQTEKPLLIILTR
jgi:hypothetical protein